MLAESKKAGLIIHEVEIETVYLNGNKSSHFQLFDPPYRFIKYS